jgi:hypothetical protein
MRMAGKVHDVPEYVIARGISWCGEFKCGKEICMTHGEKYANTMKVGFKIKCRVLKHKRGTSVVGYQRKEWIYAKRTNAGETKKFCCDLVGPRRRRE